MNDQAVAQRVTQCIANALRATNAAESPLAPPSLQQRGGLRSRERVTQCIAGRVADDYALPNALCAAKRWPAPMVMHHGSDASLRDALATRWRRNAV